jgi:hypothetical protein
MIDELDVVRQILQHLKLWVSPPTERIFSGRILGSEAKYIAPTFSNSNVRRG